MGAFHYAKDFGKFGWNSNIKVRLVITYGGGPHISVGIFRPKFAVPFLITGSLPKLGNAVKEFRMTTAISVSWPDLIGKYRSIFLRYSH